MSKKSKGGRPKKGKDKLIKLSIQLHSNELKRLKELVEEEDRSTAWLIRHAVREFYKLK